MTQLREAPHQPKPRTPGADRRGIVVASAETHRPFFGSPLSDIELARAAAARAALAEARAKHRSGD